MEKIKVIIKRPDEKKGHVTSISNTLENLQRNVEGLIETYTLFGDTIIICNEEGKLQNLPINCVCGGELFVGTIIVCGRDEAEFCDVPGEALALWKKGKLFQKADGW